ncbi:MAG TPA: preprotein translocase subunit SecE [Acidimicrobiales bacterium]|nr:preprotein translocase subunit SecE [Acidimicrobiales bacterium]
MAMNRETRRLLQRQGQIGPEGEPVVAPREQQRPPMARPAGGPAAVRTRPAEFVRDVRSELRRVAWPTRAQTWNYSVVVFICVAVLMALIFGLDTAFAKGVLFLFKK